MVGTVLMRLRATLAGLLAVVLLSLSAAAAACEARCDLASASAPCHGEAGQSRPQQAQGKQVEMPGMSMVSMACQPARQASSSDKARCTLAAPSACRHVCAGQPVLLKASGVLFVQGLYSHPAFTVVAALLWPVTPATRISGRGSPPFRTSTPVSLHTILRV